MQWSILILLQISCSPVYLPDYCSIIDCNTFTDMLLYLLSSRARSVVASLVSHAYQITKPVLRSCWSLRRIWGAECHSRFIFSIPTSTSSRQTVEQWVMSMEKDSTKTLRRWRATIKANGAPAWWETSARCSCVTSRRQNTPDLLRKHTFHCLWYYELCNCVIQVYWFNHCSLSILFYML